MTAIVFALGFVVIAFAGLAIVRPRKLLEIAEGFWDEGRRMAWVVALRVGLGVYLIAIAEACRWPDLARGLGVVFIAAGVGVLLIGRERIAGILRWWQARTDAQIRWLAPVWAAFGGVLIALAV